MINVKEYLSEGKSLKEISEILGEKVVYEETSGLVDRMNVDGGRATVAMTLEKGQTSERFVSTSGDGIYFVTLLDKTESTVNYVSLHIPFTELNTRLEAVRKENKVEERIIIEEQKNDEKPSEN